MGKNGGKREGAGRKSKAEEQRLIEKLSPLEPLAFAALKEALQGNDKQKAWATPLFFAYKFGKPTQRIEAKVTDNREDVANVFPDKTDLKDEQ